jgi:hypothetical protein
VPVHAGETIGPGLLSRILRDCKLNREQLADFLNKQMNPKLLKQKKNFSITFVMISIPLGLVEVPYSEQFE